MGASELLSHENDHPEFVPYPQRWFHQVNKVLSEFERGRVSLDNLILTLRTVICESEHMSGEFMAHNIVLLLFASSRIGFSSLSDTINYLFEDTTVLPFLKPESTTKTEALAKILNFLPTIDLTPHSNYHRHVKSLLSAIFSDSTIDLAPVLRWRFLETADEALALLRSVNALFKKGNLVLSLAVLKKLLRIQVPCFQTWATWNIAVTRHDIGLFELCAEICTEESPLTFSRSLLSLSISQSTCQEQICLHHYHDKRRSQCCKTVEKLRILTSKTYIEPDNMLLYKVYQSDLATLARDLVFHQETLESLQASDLEEILSEEAADPRKTLALACVLVSKCFLYLNRDELESAYDYWTEAREELGKLESCEFEGATRECYRVVHQRLRGQFHSVEGYFLTLEGLFHEAALAYGRSYVADPTLQQSLYQQFILLLKTGKEESAKKVLAEGIKLGGDDFRKFEEFFNH